LLARWKAQFESEGVKAFPGNGKVTGQDEEIRRLRRELSIAQQERDILKKAVGFFAKHKN
jgi:transposase